MAALLLRICLVSSLSSYQLIRENAYILAKDTLYPFYYVKVIEIMQNFEGNGNAGVCMFMSMAIKI